MDPEGIMFSEVSQTSEIQILYDVESKKENRWTNIKEQTPRFRTNRKKGSYQKKGSLGHEWNSWRRLRGANFQLQKKKKKRRFGEKKKKKKKIKVCKNQITKKKKKKESQGWNIQCVEFSYTTISLYGDRM